MVKTGYILFVAETGGGQDGNGNPIPSVKVSSQWIDCNLNTVSKEYRLSVNGQVKQAKYICYIDQFQLRSLTFSLTNINEIQIKNLNNKHLGIYQIADLEYLDLIKQIKITVTDDKGI